MESARRHLELAARTLAPRAPGALLLVCGVVGTGKSTAAEGLADALRGAVVSSDRVRKHRAGIAPTEHVSPERAAVLYDAAHTEATYAGLLERAAPIIASGRAAVLDATWAKRHHRADARRLAGDLGAPFRCVEVRCAESVALGRLERRAASGADPSDAGPARYRPSVDAFEAVDAAPGEGHVVLETDTEAWREGLPALAQRLCDGSGR